MKTIKINYGESIPTNFTGIAEYPDGNKYWYKEGKLHSEDGPAIIYPDGRKYWYKEGELHRLDGPAVEYPNGYKEWWIENREYAIYYLNLLYKEKIYIEKQKGQYGLEWLRFLTENGIEEFPVISGMKEYEDFKKVFEKLEEVETK